MTIEIVALTAGGGFIAGGCAGYFFKKVLKFAAAISGAIILVLIALQHYKIISVDTNRLVTLIQDLATRSNEMLQYLSTQTALDVGTIIAIPFFTGGFAVGFMKG